MYCSKHGVNYRWSPETGYTCLGCLAENPEPNMNEVIKSYKSYKDLGTEIGALVDEKNKSYGDSFHRCGDFLKLLYPDGIKPEQYTDALCIVRMFDKLMRVATKKDAFGESPFRDLVGYSLLGVMKDEA